MKTATDIFRKMGLNDAAEVEVLTGHARRNLYRWFKEDRQKFDVAVIAASQIKKRIKLKDLNRETIKLLTQEFVDNGGEIIQEPFGKSNLKE